jgi:hypothetical protein
MIAIQTKYLPPTNTKGSRIKAWTVGGHSATIPYPHHLSGEKCHFAAVKAMCVKHNLPWNLEGMRFGGVKDGYVFCFAISMID